MTNAAPAAPRTDFYTFFHKGLRRRLFDTIVEAGRTDVADPAARERLGARLTGLFALLRLHATIEETAAHPLYRAQAPELHTRLEGEHHHHEEEVAALEAALAKVQASGSPADGLALYRGLNRFLAGYLVHLDAEEAAMPVLWERVDEPTLAKALADVQRSRPLSDLAAAWELMLPALTPAERAGMSLGMKAAAPPPVFARFCAAAEAALAPDDWSALKMRIGI